jgi:thiamine kinase-like enzyme
MNASGRRFIDQAFKSPADGMRLLRSFLDQKTIEVAIPRAFKRSGGRLSHYERMGGITNKNYKLTLGDETLVLRLPGRGTGRFINRAHEQANQYEAAKAGVSPEALYFNRITGIKISTFLQGALTLSPADVRKPERYREIAGFLGAFHSAPIRFRNNFNGFAMSKMYESVAKTRFCTFYKGYADVRKKVFALEAELKELGSHRCACHNDLVSGNLLEVDGKLQLIDWEYSGMNDPAWDLASFLLESEFPEEHALAFLRCYSGIEGIPENLYARVRRFAVLQDFLWSLWSLLFAGANRQPDTQAFYVQYGKERFERACSGLKEIL